MPRTADRCKETTTTTGTGAITLAGAVSQYQSFLTAFGASPVEVEYAIVGQTGTEWEVGVGVFDGNDQLTRTYVKASSNSNAAVSFSAGTKDVFATALAETVEQATMGVQVAMNLGLAGN